MTTENEQLMEHPKDDITAALCQMDVRLGAVEDNTDSALRAIERACGKGADLIVLPELWSCGFDGSRIARHAEKTPSILAALGRRARAHQAVIAGSLPEIAGDSVYNTLFVVDQNGEIAAAYRKIHLFPLLSEDRWFASGSVPVLCASPGAPTGLMVCYDLRFPELCRALAVSGARIVIVSAQWPASRIAHWDVLLSARAIENQVFVIAVNRCGKDAALEYNGHSRIISPEGDILANAGESCHEVTATMHMAAVDDFRKRFSTIDERKTDAYICR